MKRPPMWHRPYNPKWARPCAQALATGLTTILFFCAGIALYACVMLLERL